MWLCDVAGIQSFGLVILKRGREQHIIMRLSSSYSAYIIFHFVVLRFKLHFSYHWISARDSCEHKMRLILLLFLITLCRLSISSGSLDDGMKSHEPCEFPYQSCWDLSWYHRITPPPESYDAGKYCYQILRQASDNYDLWVQITD